MQAKDVPASPKNLVPRWIEISQKRYRSYRGRGLKHILRFQSALQSSKILDDLQARCTTRESVHHFFQALLALERIHASPYIFRHSERLPQAISSCKTLLKHIKPLRGFELRREHRQWILANLQKSLTLLEATSPQVRRGTVPVGHRPKGSLKDELAPVVAILHEQVEQLVGPTGKPWQIVAQLCSHFNRLDFQPSDAPLNTKLRTRVRAFAAAHKDQLDSARQRHSRLLASILKNS